MAGDQLSEWTAACLLVPNANNPLGSIMPRIVLPLLPPRLRPMFESGPWGYTKTAKGFFHGDSFSSFFPNTSE